MHTHIYIFSIYFSLFKKTYNIRYNTIHDTKKQKNDIWYTILQKRKTIYDIFYELTTMFVYTQEKNATLLIYKINSVELLHLSMQRIFLMTLVSGFFMFGYLFDDVSSLFITRLMKQVKWHGLNRHSQLGKWLSETGWSSVLAS